MKRNASSTPPIVWLTLSAAACARLLLSHCVRREFCSLLRQVQPDAAPHPRRCIQAISASSISAARVRSQRNAPTRSGGVTSRDGELVGGPRGYRQRFHSAIVLISGRHVAAQPGQPGGTNGFGRLEATRWHAVTRAFRAVGELLRVDRRIDRNPYSPFSGRSCANRRARGMSDTGPDGDMVTVADLSSLTNRTIVATQYAARCLRANMLREVCEPYAQEVCEIVRLWRYTQPGR